MESQEPRKTTVTGELFPPDETTEPAQDTATATDGEGVQSTFETLAELRAICDATGEYFPLPTEALLSRGETLFNRNVDKIREALETSGVDADTVNVVLKDYAGVLAGIYSFSATPTQIQNALRGCKPYRAFNIDRYGLYMGLFVNYSRYLVLLGKYQDDVKHTDTTATEETRRKFMTGFYAAMDAKALTWLRDNGIIQPADFVGVEPAEVAEFFGRLREWAALGDYATYVFIAKYALTGTPEEIAEIIQPPVKTQSSVLEFAVRAADEQAARVDNAAERFAAMFAAEEREEQERAAQVAREQARKWTENAAPVALHETPNIICSRPVEVAPDGDLKLGRLPIQRAIDEFKAKNGDKYGLITSGAVQRAVETINYLTNFIKPNTDGRLLFRTTINDFSEYAGLVDANQEQQRALLGALLVLSDLYLVVDRPYKWIEQTNAKGHKYRRSVGGPTAARVVSVEIELNGEGGNRGLTIEIKPDAVKGKPTMINAGQYQQLRDSSAGNTPKSRFGYQILTKGHKDEYNLIAEVFGYDEKLNAATTPEELKRVKLQITKKHSRNRQSVARWFEEYAAKGIISYKYDALKKSYSWVRLDVPDVPPPEADTPNLEW